MIKNKGKFIIKFEEQDKEFVENLDWEKLNEGYNILPSNVCSVWKWNKISYEGNSRFSEAYF